MARTSKRGRLLVTRREVLKLGIAAGAGGLLAPATASTTRTATAAPAIAKKAGTTHPVEEARQANFPLAGSGTGRHG